MPNIKSAIKRVSVIEKKTLINNMIKSSSACVISILSINFFISLIFLSFNSHNILYRQELALYLWISISKYL